ncbi:hypothetical protein [Vibrio nomapromontoriensis]|uniref:hypothetical protein n=1 Tax=Vibrio nomapromontoriensis TaxID=2910246 RepID=UPI003D128F26
MTFSVSIIHRIAAMTGFSIILTFFLSTLFVELFASTAEILAVKTFILYAVWLLIPVMAITGIAGNKMAPNVTSGPIGNKKRRMPFIAMNGLFVLLPCAVYLQHLAQLGQFDVIFYCVQAVELLAGFTNLTLMTLNIRDGLKLKRQKK